MWLRHYQQQNKPYRVNGTGYLTLVRHRISLLQVTDESHLQILLNMKCGCCGQKTGKCFRLATEEEVTLWNSPE